MLTPGNQDGAVVVWHDEEITAQKCVDTMPVVLSSYANLNLILNLFQVANDPDFPYVGKHIVNLTLAQIKTLDCGSKRLPDFREFFP